MRRVLPLIFPVVVWLVAACSSTPLMPKGPPPEYEDNPTPIPSVSAAPPAGPPAPAPTPAPTASSSTPDSGPAPM